MIATIVAADEGYVINPAFKYSFDEEVVCGRLHDSQDFLTKRLAMLKQQAKGESWNSSVRFGPTIDKESRELAATERDLSSCRAQIQERKRARLGAVHELSLDQLQAIPEGERLPEENQQLVVLEARETQERKAWQIRVRTRQVDPKWMGPVFSAQICILKATRAAAVTEISTEKQYAKQLGGVIDAEKIYTLQRVVRDADEQVTQLQVDARALKARLLKCTDRFVALVATCEQHYQSGETAPDECSEERVREHVELIGPVSEQ